MIIGLTNQLRLAEVLDQHLGTYGLRNGQLAVSWLAHILSQTDHRKTAAREWANDLPHTLGQLLGRLIREVECNDDRMSCVLCRLRDGEAWAAIKQDLWTATMVVSDRELPGVRLDSTTSYSYHAVTEDGVMPFSPSKDHRPDRAQLKLLASASVPAGHLLACDVEPRPCADDARYMPLIRRVRRLRGRTALLFTGNCKMAALPTRAEFPTHGDYDVTPLPLTGETAAQCKRWVNILVDSLQDATLLWNGNRLLGASTEFERPLSTTVDSQPLHWTEQVKLVRSCDLAKRPQGTLERRLATAVAAVWALTPAPGRGKRQIHDETAL